MCVCVQTSQMTEICVWAIFGWRVCASNASYFLCAVAAFFSISEGHACVCVCVVCVCACVCVRVYVHHCCVCVHSTHILLFALRAPALVGVVE